MVSALFSWLVLQSQFCMKSLQQGSSLNSEASKPRPIDEHCVFCQAYSSNRDAFDIVWEDTDFLAFRDRRPACLHHIQLIPKVHITSVKKLTKRDADMGMISLVPLHTLYSSHVQVRRMKSIGSDILDKLQVPPTHRKMGFHIPPFNSVQHLHLHVQALPYTSFTRRLEYPIVRGFGTFDKGLSWFSEVGQTIRILDKGSTVGILPC